LAGGDITARRLDKEEKMRNIIALTIWLFFFVNSAIAAVELGIQPVPDAAPIIHPPESEPRSIHWNENLDIYVQMGKLDMPVHEDIKRCILADDGTVVYYLDGYNQKGIEPSTAGVCEMGALEKLIAIGIFTGEASDYVGHYAHNITEDTYSLITTKDDNDTLGLQDDIFTPGDEFEICTGVFNGDDGQVMVEIPAFYYKYQYWGGWHSYSVSYDQLPGYNLHPAFHKNGVDVEARYIGAYEGVLYDVSEGKYVNGLCLPSRAPHRMSFDGTAETITSDDLTHPFTNLEAGIDTIVISGTQYNNHTCGIISVTDTTITVDCDLQDEPHALCTIQTQRDWKHDILGSVAGKAPITNGTRAQFRAIAANRGDGWRQMDFDLMSAVQLLYLIDYNSFNSQLKIGAGLTDWGSSWEGWNNFNSIEKTGLSNVMKGVTGSISNGDGIKGSYMSYRGIENFYGHLLKWVDGVNLDNRTPCVCNDDTTFFDDYRGYCYTSLGVTLPNSYGQQRTLKQTGKGFLPASVGAKPGTHIADYYWPGSGWTVMVMGGNAAYGDMAGTFYLDIGLPSSYSHRCITGRLCY